jgi:pyrroline-5-carboxylate reductase
MGDFINNKIKLGILGGGVMGEAILARLLQEKIYLPDTVVVAEPQVERRDYLEKHYKVLVTSENRAVLSAREVLLLAVKPQVLDLVISQLGDLNVLAAETAIVSILAGVTLAKLEAVFGERPTIRSMPNTPATVGAGMTAISPGKYVQLEHLDRAKKIFAAVGEVVEVSEGLMDAVTGLSGSGPAYVALMVEALADGGVAAGLPRAIASQLALQTVFGTACLLRESGLHPAQLKDRVTSPGGTTIAGIVELEKAGFRSAAIEAVRAACKRSQELGG